MPTDPTLYATNQSFLGVVKEATRGTAPTTGFLWVPVKSPQTTPTQTYLADEGFRGSPVTTYDVVMGTRYDMFEFKGDAHLDCFPALIEGILGGTDTVTGTTAPYTHTQPLLNSATTGSQPPSYTLQDFNGYICQQMTGAQAVSLEIAFTATQSLSFTSKYYGLINTTIATPAGASFSSTDRLIPAWNNTVTIGSSVGTLMEGTVTIDRSTEAVMTAGQQGPYSVFTGPAKVTGKFTFAVISADPIYAFGLSRSQQATTFVFTDPASTHTFTIQMTAMQLENTKYDRSKNYVTVSADFEAVSNATDASSGYSPIKCITTNAVSAAY